MFVGFAREGKSRLTLTELSVVFPWFAGWFSGLPRRIQVMVLIFSSIIMVIVLIVNSSNSSSNNNTNNDNAND